MKKWSICLFILLNCLYADEKCSICLEYIKSSDTSSELCCHHVFHTKCIIECLEAGYHTCPICREQVFFHREIFGDSSQHFLCDEIPFITFSFEVPKINLHKLLGKALEAIRKQQYEQQQLEKECVLLKIGHELNNQDEIFKDVDKRIFSYMRFKQKEKMKLIKMMKNILTSHLQLRSTNLGELSTTLYDDLLLDLISQFSDQASNLLMENNFEFFLTLSDLNCPDFVVLFHIDNEYTLNVHLNVYDDGAYLSTNGVTFIEAVSFALITEFYDKFPYKWNIYFEGLH